MAKSKKAKTAEVTIDAMVENHGSLFLVRLLTSNAKDWINEHVSEEAQFFGWALVVEPRYIEDLIESMQGDGLVVR